MSSSYASMHGGPEIALATPCRKTLAESLLEAGYWTAGFTANASCGSIAGFHRGFGVYRDCKRKPTLPDEAPSDWKKQWPRLLELGIFPRDTQTLVDAQELTDIALQWLAQKRSGPYFLWLHYLDPHWPCQMTGPSSTPEDLAEAWQDVDTFLNKVIPARGKFDPGAKARARWEKRYDDCLGYTDREIGRLLDTLRKQSDWDRTIVAVTGDHGEEFFERGTWHHSWNQLHREGVHIPLIIRLPETESRRVSNPVSLLDLSPTLLDYMDIRPPKSMIGQSLRSLIDGDACSDRPVLTEMMGHTGGADYKLAIRDANWNYIYDLEHPRDSKIFNVAEDPGELKNLKDEFPLIFRKFEMLRLEHITKGLMQLLEWPASGKDPIVKMGTEGHTDDDPVLREQLEALGYL